MQACPFNLRSLIATVNKVHSIFYQTSSMAIGSNKKSSPLNYNVNIFPKIQWVLGKYGHLVMRLATESNHYSTRRVLK